MSVDLLKFIQLVSIRAGIQTEAIWIRASLVAQTVENLPAMQETWVRFLGQEDPMGKGTATHSSILACRVPRTEETGRQCHGGKESDTTERLTLSLFNLGPESVFLASLLMPPPTLAHS